MVKRKDLKPGRLVKNMTTGTVGEVRTDPENKSRLRTAHHNYVAVRTTVKTGKNTGKLIYPYWLLEHIEIVSML